MRLIKLVENLQSVSIVSAINMVKIVITILSVIYGDTAQKEMLSKLKVNLFYFLKIILKHNSDAPGTCGRALFNCDLQYANDSFEVRNEWNQDYHWFQSLTGFDNQEHCRRRVGVQTEKPSTECCGDDYQPFHLINLKNQKCCNGSPKPINDQC